MSFDLAFWYPDDADVDPAAAFDVYDRVADGELGVVPEHPAVARFAEEMLEVYPETDAGSPWAAACWVTPESVVVSISWSRAEEVGPVLASLAWDHGLVTYDPQAQVLHLPVSRVRPGRRERATVEVADETGETSGEG
ncbi:hypothetical protein ACFQHV_13425 [Promicromonospora thailandica]|uniref:Uncharacterized protein n=1 Tax=Promicromonospora thailandica TaxID=765201 RepID=A0A9X2JWS3_9MICO|nr:hypothetical protein [Promicromonospora thailandica]MCP2266910.1 hypothetical protein [Promicromonospora thailandica]BFF16580.1 hypothetical protein GCM10025730_01010 [Promicromonospora thailandica]